MPMASPAAHIDLPDELRGARIILRPYHQDDAGALLQRGVKLEDIFEQIQRGEYLARAGDCIACHTVRGGEAHCLAAGFLVHQEIHVALAIQSHPGDTNRTLSTCTIRCESTRNRAKFRACW